VGLRDDDQLVRAVRELRGIDRDGAAEGAGLIELDLPAVGGMSWNAGSIVTSLCGTGELRPAPGSVSTSGLHVPDNGAVGSGDRRRAFS
jgi:hypothetical protein